MMSARFPPTCCWMSTAVTMSEKSGLPTRPSISVSARSKGFPRFVSRRTRANSVLTGGFISLEMISIVCRKEKPALRELETSVRQSAIW